MAVLNRYFFAGRFLNPCPSREGFSGQFRIAVFIFFKFVPIILLVCGVSRAQDPLQDLQTWLDQPRSSRADLSATSFGTQPLTAGQVAQAWQALVADRDDYIREAWQSEWDDKTFVNDDNDQLRFEYRTYGEEPPEGRDLYISMHGGGNAAPSVNDQQWQNQITLYQPDGIYLAPRAPTDTWNLWHQPHIDPFFDRVIEACVVYLGINPNRVYIMGYSAGGDGVYQVGPRMADRWAAAAMMAGHPNESSPHSLRNIGFTIHVGELDDAYDRNLVAAEWADWLDSLETADPGGYPHEVQIHDGKPHWMDLEDAVALDWMDDFTRDPFPDKIVWHQDDILHKRFYWLEVPGGVSAAENDNVIAEIEGQTVNILETDLDAVTLRLSDSLVDLDQPVTVRWLGEQVYRGTLFRTIANLWEALELRGDRRTDYSAKITVSEEVIPVEKGFKETFSRLELAKGPSGIRLTLPEFSGTAAIALHAPNGRLLHKRTISQEEIIFLDLTAYPAGAYFVSVSLGSRALERKIIHIP